MVSVFLRNGIGMTSGCFWGVFGVFLVCFRGGLGCGFGCVFFVCLGVCLGGCFFVCGGVFLCVGVFLWGVWCVWVSFYFFS